MQRQSPRVIARLILCLLGTVSCGDDVSVVAPPAAPKVRSISVSPTTAALRLNETLVMVATVDADSGGNRGVVWSSADPRRVTVTANGIVTAVGEGTAVITASSMARPELVARAAISVLPGAQVRSVSVVPAMLTLRLGSSTPLVAQVAADSGADRAVTWSSVDPSRVSVSASGVVTGLAEGTAVVSATSRARPDIVGSSTVTIIAAAGVKSVAVTPQILEITIGQAQPLAVTVQADDGISRAVTFATSAPAVATVSALGVVTGVTPGTATVTVAATADPRVSASVVVTVKPPAPPQVSIQSVLQGTTGLPVNLASASGQLDVVINAERGQDPLAQVDLVVSQGGRDSVVASQTFSNVTSGRVIAQEAHDAPPSRAAPSSITLSFRSDGFDPATGKVGFTNGITLLRAVARSVSSGTAAPPTASNSVAIRLRNTDGFYVSMRGASSTGIAAAADAAGLTWIQAGAGLVVTSTPVTYSGSTVSVRTIVFPGSAVAGTLLSAKPGIAVDTLLLPDYTSPASGALYVTGELPAMTGIDQNGNPLTLVGTPGTSGAGILNGFTSTPVAGVPLRGVRIDNAAPPTGAVFTLSTATNNSNNWVNGAYAFATGLTGLVGDAGVGLFGSNSAATASSAQAKFRVTGGALSDTSIVATGAELAAVNSNLTYSAAARYTDRLGNARFVPLSPSGTVHPLSTFGVDLQAPTARYATTSALGQALISSSGTSITTSLLSGGGTLAFGVEANDDRSGFGSAPVYVALTRFAQPNPPGAFTGTTTCVVGTVTSGACTPTGAAFAGSPLADGFRQLTTPLDNGTGVEGYYTYIATVRDQAGNESTMIRNSTLYDVGSGASAPQVGTIGIPAVLRGNQPGAFVPLAVDNVELISGSLYIAYPNLLNLPGSTTAALDFSGLTGTFSVGTLFDKQLTSPVSGGVGFTVPLFIRAVEITDAAHAPLPYAGQPVKPNGVNVVLRDGPNVAGQAATMPTNVAILAGQVESPTSATPGFAALTGLKQLLRWRKYLGGGSAFEAVGPSGQTESPFSRVLYLKEFIGGGVAPNANLWRVVDTQTVPVGSDNGIERVWRYNLVLSGAGNYVALGVSAEGDAIASQVVACSTSGC
ncbi:MAG: Ig-like domain-containing protein [Gemmatimonadaceae bacterium]|nr:Ig-like domain-containing protein [Gemmatimonadaceae bacterium]